MTDEEILSRGSAPDGDPPPPATLKKHKSPRINSIT